MRTVDTDVLVILISHFHYITSLLQIWSLALHLGLEKILCSTASTVSVQKLVVREARYLPCFILSLDAILPLRSMVKDKRVHGKLY